MIKDLVSISQDEIKESASQVLNDKIKIAYLEDSISNEHDWSEYDISKWIEEDLDD